MSNTASVYVFTFAAKPLSWSWMLQALYTPAPPKAPLVLRLQTGLARPRGPSGKLCLCALACALALPAWAAGARHQVPPRSAALQGVVTRVVDGDSLWFTPAVAPNTAAGVSRPAPQVVRLARIDAPELCQTYGVEAKAALAALVLHKPVRLQRLARDVYGRVVAHITVDGVDVATRMVEEGQAWSARQRNDHGPLLKQERMARALGRGLHGAGGAVLPRDFRRSHGPCGPRAANTPR